MTETIAEFSGRIAKVQGPAGSGKTEALVRRCVFLLEHGAGADSILVATSSAFAAQAFRDRLVLKAGEKLHEAAKAVQVKSAVEACIDVLGSEAARAATGRTPRLLATPEYNFLVEDLKTTGEPIRQLRKMLAYFKREMAAGRPRSEWMIGGEEETILDLMDRSLALQGAMLPQEVGCVCADYLKSEAGQAARGCFEYVIADDFQNATRAIQTALCMMTGTQLLVAGNADEAHSGIAGDCNPAGFSEFEKLRRDVEVFTLDEAFGNGEVVSYADALLDQEGMDAQARAEKTSSRKNRPVARDEGAEPDHGIVSVKWRTPEEELNGVTKYLRRVIDRTHEPLESRTAVLVANKRWALLARNVLDERGFSTSIAGALHTFSGDPRESARAGGLVAYIKLALLANPKDAVAWRAWCGLDNYLTNSDAWTEMQAWAGEQSVSLCEALSRLADAQTSTSNTDPFLRADVLARRWKEGQEFIAGNARRKGFALLKAIGGAGLVEFSDIEKDLIGDETAEQLFSIVYRHIHFPVWPESRHTLRIAMPDALDGQDYDNVFVIGAVDGFFPSRDAFEVISTDEERARIMQKERRSFYAAVAKAGELLVLSHFSKAPLELAEKTKMQVVRVRSEGDERIAIVRPSCFIEQGGAHAPQTVGGDALLAQEGL